MADMIDKLRQSWSVILIAATLVGSGVAYTSWIEAQIGGRIASAEQRFTGSSYPAIKGERLETKLERIDNTLDEVRKNQILILKAIERLDERTSRN